MRFDPRVAVQPHCNQVEYNLYMQQEAMRSYCEFRGIVVAGYSPLGTGSWLSGGLPSLLDDPVLGEVAAEAGRAPAAVALRFLLQLSPNAVVLPKSKTPGRIRANIDMAFELNEDQMRRLAARERCVRYGCSVRSWGVDVFVTARRLSWRCLPRVPEHVDFEYESNVASRIMYTTAPSPPVRTAFTARSMSRLRRRRAPFA